MIYRFSHFSTDHGRRVQFIANAADMRRAAPALDGVEAKWRPFGLEEVIVLATPGGARMVADALGSLGGDAAVASRMLTDALDGMVDELRASRATGPTVGTVGPASRAGRRAVA
jgi:hypothetical protein